MSIGSLDQRDLVRDGLNQVWRDFAEQRRPGEEGSWWRRGRPSTRRTARCPTAPSTRPRPVRTTSPPFDRAGYRAGQVGWLPAANQAVEDAGGRVQRPEPGFGRVEQFHQRHGAPPRSGLEGTYNARPHVRQRFRSTTQELVQRLDGPDRPVLWSFRRTEMKFRNTETGVAMSHPLRHTVNCSMLFTELPLLERPAAAAAAGFKAVELWWPWLDHPFPARRGRRVRGRGLRCRRPAGRLNFYAGDMPGRDRGVLSVARPGRPSSAPTSRSPSASASVWAAGVQRALRQPGRRSPTRSPGRPRRLRTRARRRGPSASARPSWSRRSTVPKPYPLRTAPTPSRSSMRSAATGTATSASCATCTTWP